MGTIKANLAMATHLKGEENEHKEGDLYILGTRTLSNRYFFIHHSPSLTLQSPTFSLLVLLLLFAVPYFLFTLLQLPLPCLGLQLGGPKQELHHAIYRKKIEAKPQKK